MGRRTLARKAAAGLVLASLWAGSAAAQSAGCTALNAFGAANPFTFAVTTLTAQPLDAGETVTISGSSATVGWGVNDGGGIIGGPYGASAGAFSQTVVIGGGGAAQIDLFATGISTSIADFDVTCVPVAATGGSAASSVAEISAAAQQRALRFALDRNTRTRFSEGGAAAVGRSGVFASTQGLGQNLGRRMEYNAWVSLEGRSFDGAIEGQSTDLLIGADRFVTNDLLVGILFGIGQTEADEAGTSAEARSALIGGYFAHQMPRDLQLDGYLALGRAEYDQAGAQFDTDRAYAGFAISGNLGTRSGTFQPRASIDATWEEFPGGTGVVAGGTSQDVTVAIGGRFDWSDGLGQSDLQPYASLDLEYGRREAAGGTDSDYLAPRLGLGVTGYVGRGALSAGIDAGHSGADTRDLGAFLNYEFNF